ncbi:hypothetical protein ACFU98_44400 [Streptomyces sp. NPDC057575]|uniref:hypothetical protein n=1 Tax=unclassified Streptomyces TaxID=2593676 RepID=UPI0036753C54
MSNITYTPLIFFRQMYGDPAEWSREEFELWLQECDAYRAVLADIAQQFPDVTVPEGVALR